MHPGASTSPHAAPGSRRYTGPMVPPAQPRIAPEDWYRTTRLSDSVTLIAEPWIEAFYRCNIWHVRGRDRDMLVDSGMGVVSLRQYVPLVTERRCLAVTSHTHLRPHRRPPRIRGSPGTQGGSGSFGPSHPAGHPGGPLCQRRHLHRAAAAALHLHGIRREEGAGHAPAGRRRHRGPRRPAVPGHPYAGTLTGGHRAVRARDRHPVLRRHRL